MAAQSGSSCEMMDKDKLFLQKYVPTSKTMFGWVCPTMQTASGAVKLFHAPSACYPDRESTSIPGVIKAVESLVAEVRNLTYHMSESPDTPGKLAAMIRTEGWQVKQNGYLGPETHLQVAARPFSEWEFSLVQSSGVENSKPGEFGNKGAAIIVLDANHVRYARQTARLCILNTHQSFKGNTQRRARDLVASLRGVKEPEKCDQWFFVGDFNTRMHCRHPEHPNEPEALFTSFDRVVDQICEGTDPPKCALTHNNSEPYDEMWRMLNTPGDVDCEFETSADGLSALQVKSVDKFEIGALLRDELWQGFKEAGPVNFGPTYKLYRRKKAFKYPKRLCLENDQKCLANKDNKPKHNPAFTDRVLYKAKDHWFVAPQLYRRVAGQLESDHAPVVAVFDATSKVVKSSGLDGLAPVESSADDGGMIV